ncbi:MAG: cysteine synthase family protein [Thermoplasmata archaeon]|uniref:Cysteine synthase family protein n=1 Tax=Candidatus Sysuiplasma superficiale TaxID=2823368 RepID=A0A8J7YSM8_9ARCH|nr:cysteine synthase family protein [Candidatus Sysuiplasma superficiale]MBX8643352.1 cysteine synthase family protein [Candidatus Sysuiplasma superficiale]MCL4347219.1 cysteine synthase family protein [Candidatus Thermoplasmatota archaeon]
MICTELKSQYGEDILSKIGNTPLLRLGRIMELQGGAELYAKAEWFNPGGSVKDRAALRIIEDALRRGSLSDGKILLDASSGNTGIAYAMICAVKGIRSCIVVPRNIGKEKLEMLRAYGAEVVLSDPMEGTDGAQRLAKKLDDENPGMYYYADQYNNSSNWRAHYDGTGQEILRQTGGKIDYFVAGVGTGGTFTGTAKFLKEKIPSLTAVAVEPDSPLHGIEGLKRMDSSIRPGIYDETLADEHIYVKTEDAQRMVITAARKEGLLLGVSSGAALKACEDIFRREGKCSVVTVFPDSGQRYLGERFWEANL